MPTPDCPLAAILAQRLRAGREELTARWLERISSRVSIDANHVFPTADLLDHVPLLVDGIATYIEDPAEDIAADIPVIAKARELGELRYRQGFDAYQIFKEYELLGGVLFSFLARIIDDIEEPCTRSELLNCGHRLFRAVTLIQQATTMHYLRMSNEQVREREERLRAFNRMVSHELKSRVGAIQGAHVLLTEPWLDDGARERFLRMIGENVGGIEAMLGNLLVLSRLETRVQQHHHVRLPQAVAEVVRQLREMARAHAVTVKVAGDLPEVEVNAAVVELCLTNYISNGIKYADREKVDRWIEIRGRVERRDDKRGESLVVEVRDNGVGVPDDARTKLFERFFRAHDQSVTGVEGTGLGLSIVRETVESIGGRAWAEVNGPGGSTFAFAMPCRRGEVVYTPETSDVRRLDSESSA
ncbi:MAG: ATP-binding protein [Gemmatimonadaceae bacterium]